MTLPVLPPESELDEPRPAPPFLVEVAFKGSRRAFYRCNFDAPPALGTAVVVEVERGEDLGRVHSTGARAALRSAGVPHGTGGEMPTEIVLRAASVHEIARERALRQEDESARRTAAAKVRAANLDLKLSDAEWQFDRKKLTFYFTAEKRIDFRALVRDLAAVFRARIELKQYGVRDEAKRLSGIGRCGREYCSAAWLPELRPVNLGVAKDQRLSLNPSQISGACGRLMCCLRYEHEFYVAQRKRFPKEGRILVTDRGEEKVIAIDIFRERVTLRNPEGETRIAELVELAASTVASGASTGSLEREADHETGRDEFGPDASEPADDDGHGPDAAERALDRAEAPSVDQPPRPPRTDRTRLPSTGDETRRATRTTRPERPHADRLPLAERPTSASQLPPPATPAPSNPRPDATTSTGDNNASATVAFDGDLNAPGDAPGDARGDAREHAREHAPGRDAAASGPPDESPTDDEGQAPRRRRRGRRGGRRGRGSGGPPNEGPNQPDPGPSPS